MNPTEQCHVVVPWEFSCRYFEKNFPNLYKGDTRVYQLERRFVQYTIVDVDRAIYAVSEWSRGIIKEIWICPYIGQFAIVYDDLDDKSQKA